MPPDPNRADSPQHWLRYARADLALARVPLPAEGLLEQLCFHAQQAVEKSIKALLIHFGISFPYTHDLRALIDLLPMNIERPANLPAADDLIAYAVLGRYPGETEPVLEEEYRRSVAVAEVIYAWAESVIGSA